MRADNHVYSERYYKVIRHVSSTDLCELADWAEMQSLSSPRGSCVIGDIERYVKPDDTGAMDDSAEDESIAVEVLDLISLRERVLGDLYPFEVHRSIVVKPKKFSVDHSAYLFNLFIASLDVELIDAALRHLFEIECMNVLHDHFGGESYHFGWTKFNASKGAIQRRIEDFCEQTSLCWKARKPVLVSPDRKDIGIDAIVWKQSDDLRDNAFVAFAQCASGSNWRKKLESSVINHINDCIETVHSGPGVKCFMTPFDIPNKIWRDTAQATDGLLFDRSRLVLESYGKARRGRVYDAESIKWVKEILVKLRASGLQRAS